MNAKKITDSTKRCFYIIPSKAQFSPYLDYTRQDFGIQYTPKKILRTCSESDIITVTVLSARCYELKKQTTAQSAQQHANAFPNML
jgi:hypothetical protein